MQNQAKAEKTAEGLSAELARSRASEAEARRERAAAAAAAKRAASAAEAQKAASVAEAKKAASAAKAGLEAAAARAREEEKCLREAEGAAAARERERGAELERELEGAREACEGLRERAVAAEEELGRGRAELAGVVARKDEMVGFVGYLDWLVGWLVASARVFGDEFIASVPFLFLGVRSRGSHTYHITPSRDIMIL